LCVFFMTWTVFLDSGKANEAAEVGSLSRIRASQCDVKLCEAVLYGFFVSSEAEEQAWNEDTGF